MDIRERIKAKKIAVDKTIIPRFKGDTAVKQEINRVIVNE